MHSLAYERPDYNAPCDSSSEEKERKMLTVYPELHIRADEDGMLPALPDGEFYIIAKAQKTAYRSPIDEGEEPSCDIAIMAIQSVDASMVEDMIGEKEEMMAEDEDGERLKSSLRKSMTVIIGERPAKY